MSTYPGFYWAKVRLGCVGLHKRLELGLIILREWNSVVYFPAHELTSFRWQEVDYLQHDWCEQPATVIIG